MKPPQYDGNFRVFKEQLSFYIIATEAEQRKKAILLSLLPGRLFELAADLVAPSLLSSDEVTYDIIVDKISAHEHPPVSSLVARYEFDSMVRLDSESVAEFSARLKNQATKCKFSEESRKERLRDRFISGLNDVRLVSNLLLLEENVTLETVIEKAITYEKTLADAKLMSALPSTAAAGMAEKRSLESVTCHGCGKNGHYRSSCKKKSTCKKCGKFGHVELFCRTPTSENDQRGPSSAPEGSL